MIETRSSVRWPLVLLCSALLGCPMASSKSGGVEASQSSPEARQWLTYRSEAYGYTIDYPSSARTSAQGASTRFQFAERFERHGSEVNDELTFEVRAFDASKGLSARRWVESHVIKDQGAVQSQGPVTIDGVPGYEAVLRESDESEHYVVVVENGQTFELSFVESASPSLAFTETLSRKSHGDQNSGTIRDSRDRQPS